MDSFTKKGRDIIFYTKVETRLLFGYMESWFLLTI